MSDLIIRTAARAAVARQSVAEQLVRSVQRAAARLGREEAGQDLIEYAGIIVLVAAIIGALITLNIPSKVETAVSNAITKIFSSGG
jgi:Flp pilus assembly pilin Flp